MYNNFFFMFAYRAILVAILCKPANAAVRPSKSSSVPTHRFIGTHDFFFHTNSYARNTNLFCDMLSQREFCDPASTFKAVTNDMHKYITTCTNTIDDFGIQNASEFPNNPVFGFLVIFAERAACDDKILTVIQSGTTTPSSNQNVMQQITSNVLQRLANDLQWHAYGWLCDQCLRVQHFSSAHFGSVLEKNPLMADKWLNLNDVFGKVLAVGKLPGSASLQKGSDSFERDKLLFKNFFKTIGPKSTTSTMIFGITVFELAKRAKTVDDCFAIGGFEDTVKTAILELKFDIPLMDFLRSMRSYALIKLAEVSSASKVTTDLDSFKVGVILLRNPHHQPGDIVNLAVFNAARMKKKDAMAWLKIFCEHRSLENIGVKWNHALTGAFFTLSDSFDCSVSNQCATVSNALSTMVSVGLSEAICHDTIATFIASHFEFNENPEDSKRLFGLVKNMAQSYDMISNAHVVADKTYKPFAGILLKKLSMNNVFGYSTRCEKYSEPL